MSLVSYDASSDSENEEIERNHLNDSTNNIANNTEVNNLTKTDLNDDVPLPTTGIFNVLPKPKQTDEVIEEEQDEFLSKKAVTVEKPKKQKQPIKIGIPCLKDYENDDLDEARVNKPKVSKASGLFSVLPPPKGIPLSNKSFIPNVLMKQNRPAVKVAKKNIKKIPQKYLKEDTVEDSDDDLGDIEIPETFDDETWQKVCGPKAKQVVVKRKIVEPVNTVDATIELAPEPEKPYDGLDNVAFKELVGSTKRRKENIKLVDINEEDILSDKDAWLVKSLTDPNYAPKTEVEEVVNDTCRRKHHITYLAQQAKVNEQELQNQWSQNKFTRKQTQSKYGF